MPDQSAVAPTTKPKGFSLARVLRARRLARETYVLRQRWHFFFTSPHDDASPFPARRNYRRVLMWPPGEPPI